MIRGHFKSTDEYCFYSSIRLLGLSAVSDISDAFQYLIKEEFL